LARNTTDYYIGIFEVIEAGKEASIEFFNEWVAEVKRSVPEDRLLVFQAKEGWQPLCKFLDLPVPEEPFPRVNDTNQLKNLQNKLKVAAYFFVYGVPAMLALGGYALATWKPWQ